MRAVRRDGGTAPLSFESRSSEVVVIPPPSARGLAMLELRVANALGVTATLRKPVAVGMAVAIGIADCVATHEIESCLPQQLRLVR